MWPTLQSHVRWLMDLHHIKVADKDNQKKRGTEGRLCRARSLAAQPLGRLHVLHCQLLVHSWNLLVRLKLLW